MILRAARHEDLGEILALLAAGQASSRGEAAPEVPGPGHAAALEAIAADPNQRLVCAEADDGAVVGTMQLTFIPGLARGGAWRMQIEAMRVRGDRRGEGLGREMVGWALERARERGCGLVQLTSDASRVDAHRFYASLGFEASHVGFKLRP
ncbi:MAG: Transcriptional regulator [uncultured Solirubrobacteraceae bacterium]|uniref:Transcriptional regulator n=1 Tax=uncultured Solirubrobacteraceae bacterium TaxID=1162706 RepID=A0A6J4TES4_9ACTN|nr:MAG: Transcriptional regulator [uncultured Solirubrobacteraceae bacterium]